jgi:hypothetical protein
MMKINNQKYFLSELQLSALVFLEISPQFTTIKIKLSILKHSNNSKKLGENLNVTLRSLRVLF